jgi:hypothetical protein
VLLLQQLSLLLLLLLMLSVLLLLLLLLLSLLLLRLGVPGHAHNLLEAAVQPAQALLHQLAGHRLGLGGRRGHRRLGKVVKRRQRVRPAGRVVDLVERLRELLLVRLRLLVVVVMRARHCG